MTIAQAFNEIAVAQGGTASTSGTIAGAIDALNDALAGSDQKSAQTIEDAVRLLGQNIGGGSSVTVESLTATENKTYTAPEGKAYSPVTVNVSGGTSTHDITCYYVDPQTYETTLIDGLVHSTTINDGHYDSTDTPVQTADAGSVLIAEMHTPSGLATCTPMGYGTANAESPMHADIIDVGNFSSEYIFVMPDADVVVFYSVNPE